MAATLWSHESALKTAGVYVEHVRRGNGAPLPAAEDVRRRSAAIFRRIDVPTTIGCSGRPTDDARPRNCPSSQRGAAALDSCRSG